MKQSYVPPHKRQTQDKNKIQYTTQGNKDKISKITKTEKRVEKPEKIKKLDINDTSQFPEFGNTKTINVSNTLDKPTLSSIFKKSLLNKKKTNKPKMKKGWIHLTKNGIIDSLTPEERKEEDESYERRIFEINLRRMCVENERKLQYRRENDHTYLWEELRIIDEYEDIELDEESDYDSYEESSQTEDDFYENYNNKELW